MSNDVQTKVVAGLIHQMNKVDGFDAFNASEVVAHAFNMSLDEALNEVILVKRIIDEFPS